MTTAILSEEGQNSAASGPSFVAFDRRSAKRAKALG
jgi:hypothetical protein